MATLKMSKLTEKYQATIPAEVRSALKLQKGDSISFEVGEGKVSLRKATPMDLEWAKAIGNTLAEWTSENDEKAYRDL